MSVDEAKNLGDEVVDLKTEHHHLLLPCPFCGGQAAWGEGEQKTRYGNEQVYCTDCWAITAPEGNKVEAAENWNSRASVSALQRELAFYFGAYHGTLGHQVDALACTVNNCVRVRNLCLALVIEPAQRPISDHAHEELGRNYTIDDGGGESPGILGRSGILEHIAAVLDDDYILEDGKSLEITIRRHDMTREQIDALPEV